MLLLLIGLSPMVVFAGAAAGAPFVRAALLSAAAAVSDPAMVDVRLASNAATASGLSVCEKLSGGNGTDPGAGVVDPADAAPAAAADDDMNPGYAEANFELALAAFCAYFSIASAAAWAVAELGLDEFQPFTADTAAWAAAATADVCCCACCRYDCWAHSSAMFVKASSDSTWTAGRSCRFSQVSRVGIQFLS